MSRSLGGTSLTTRSPIKISPESAELIGTLLGQATEKIRPAATRRRGKPAAGEGATEDPDGGASQTPAEETPATNG